MCEFPHILLISEFSAYFSKMRILHIFSAYFGLFGTKNIKMKNIEILFSNSVIA